MHHFVTEMCTFLFQNGVLWDIRLMHFGICEIGWFILLSGASDIKSCGKMNCKDFNMTITDNISYNHYEKNPLQ